MILLALWSLQQIIFATTLFFFNQGEVQPGWEDGNVPEGTISQVSAGKTVETQRVHVWLWLALITWVKHSLKFILDKTYKYKLQLHSTDHYLLSA